MRRYDRLAASFMIALAVAGCGESQFDLARKPELIEQVVASAIEKCDMKEPIRHDATYEQRLRTILHGAESESLDFLITNGVTVCLDKRMPNQVNGFWDKEMGAIYYGGDTKVIGLWDNGIVAEGREVFKRDTLDYNSDFITKFPSYVRDGDFSLSDQFAFGGRYNCGKGCTTERWKSQQDFDQDTIAKNPQLMKPPITSDYASVPQMTRSYSF